MLFIYSYNNDFFNDFLFYSIKMDSSNTDNHSKASAFNRFKSLLYKYYHRFSKISRVGEHLDQFLSIDWLLKNDNVSQLGMRKNPITPLYNKIAKGFLRKKRL